MNASPDTSVTICYHHKKAFAKFSSKEMSCNLFRIHTGFSKAKVTSVIDLQTAKNLENKFPEIVPGLKFCPKCLNSCSRYFFGTKQDKNFL